MHILELTQPGTRLRGIDDETGRRDTEGLLHLLRTCISDAALSLSMFEASLADATTSMAAQLARRRDRAMRAAQGEAVDIWADDPGVPLSYSQRIPFIHAKSFLYAMDTIEKSLTRLQDLPNAPAEVDVALDHFQLAFPSLRHLRNSSHHVEDRVQGKAHSRRIKPLPAHEGAPASQGAMTVDRLDDNRLGATLADGSYGEVEVSLDSALSAQRLVQFVHDAYTWAGPEVRLPL